MKESKNEIFSFLSGTLTDISLSRYKVHWGRISQMQQSESILLAVISFTIAANFSILHYSEFFTKNSPVFLPTLITVIIVCIFSVFCLFNVCVNVT